MLLAGRKINAQPSAVDDATSSFGAGISSGEKDGDDGTANPAESSSPADDDQLERRIRSPDNWYGVVSRCSLMMLHGAVPVATTSQSWVLLGLGLDMAAILEEVRYAAHVDLSETEWDF